MLSGTHTHPVTLSGEPLHLITQEQKSRGEIQWKQDGMGAGDSLGSLSIKNQWMNVGSVRVG